MRINREKLADIMKKFWDLLDSEDLRHWLLGFSVGFLLGVAIGVL